MNVRLSKIRSVHTYVIPRTVYFDSICKPSKIDFFFQRYEEIWFHIIYLNYRGLVFYSKIALFFGAKIRWQTYKTWLVDFDILWWRKCHFGERLALAAILATTRMGRCTRVWTHGILALLTKWSAGGIQIDLRKFFCKIELGTSLDK